jgi:hypothetical protein
MKFVEINTPDPTTGAGPSPMLQSLQEDIPRQIARYGKDTAVFGTNCPMQDVIMVLALIISITAGMGLNFAIVVGAICAQVGLVIAVDYQLSGFESLLLITCVGLFLSTILGYLIGLCLNRARGRVR